MGYVRLKIRSRPRSISYIYFESIYSYLENHNGQVLEVDENVLYGICQNITEMNLQKEGEFIFNGWSPSVSVCKGDIEYPPCLNLFSTNR